MAKATPMKKKAVVRIAFNRVLEDGLNFKGWDLLFAPGIQATNRGGDGWVLVHQASGLLIGPTFRTLDEGMDFAREVAPLTDWTLSARSVRTLEVNLGLARATQRVLSARVIAAYGEEIALAA